MAGQVVWRHDVSLGAVDAAVRGVFLLFTGLVSGFFAGMGMGGGTLLIPALTLLFGISQKGAQGINLLSFLPAAVLALYIHKKGGRLEKGKNGRVILFGIAGAAAGALLAHFINEPFLRKAFGAFLMAMAVLQFKR